MGCNNQEKRVSQVIKKVAKEQRGTCAVVLMDEEMKFEDIRWREKSSERDGEKGV